MRHRTRIGMRRICSGITHGSTIARARKIAVERLRAISSRDAELDQGDFTEGHELDRKMRVSKQMIGRRSSQAEAKKLLAEHPALLHQRRPWDPDNRLPQILRTAVQMVL
jgi:hypothetical protein